MNTTNLNKLTHSLKTSVEQSEEKYHNQGYRLRKLEFGFLYRVQNSLFPKDK